MTDTEMSGGGVALSLASPTHSHLADKINGGAMDVSHTNAAASVADSTVTNRLYVPSFGSLPGRRPTFCRLVQLIPHLLQPRYRQQAHAFYL